MFGCFDCDLRSAASQDNVLNSNVTNLTSLLMGNVYSLDPHSLHTLLEPNKGNLTELNINGCHKIDTAKILLLGKLGYLKEVVSLDLGDCDINDRSVELLIEHAPRLRHLSLERTKITGVGVKAVVLKPHDKLDHLVLHNCQGVSPDAVEFARASGVKVDCYFPDASRKSKKVRLD